MVAARRSNHFLRVLTSIKRIIQEQQADVGESGAHVMTRVHGFQPLEQRVLLDAAALETLDQVTDSQQITIDSVDEAVLDDSISSQQVAGQSGNLVVVDESVSGWQDIVDDLPEGALVEFIRSGEDGISQLAAITERYADLNSIHIISHGENGTLYLGGSAITRSDLTLYQAALETVGQSLAESGDIFLYGCNLAASEDGQALVQGLATATGADVAASVDVTGSATRGGDWDLEYQVGQVDKAATIDSDYAGILVTGWQDIGGENGPVTGDQAGWSVAADGQWIVVGTTANKVLVYDVSGPNHVLDQTIPVVNGGTGVSVDISGNLLIFGDRANNSAEIWRYDGSNWVRQQTLTGANDYGWDVAIDSSGATEYAAVSALNQGEGTVYGYYSNNGGTSWAYAGAVSETPGERDDNFGYAIDLAGGTLLVGAPEYDRNQSWGSDDQNEGRVYLYNMTTSLANGNRYHFETGDDNSNFGFSVDADYQGGTLYWVAGAPRNYDPSWGSPTHGRIEVFENTTRTHFITGNEAGIGGDDRFGHAVAIAANGAGGATVIAGAPTGHAGNGWAFRFDNLGSGGDDAPDFTYPNPGAGYYRGYSVALTRDIAVIGNPNADTNGTDSGRIDIYFNNQAPQAVVDSGSTGENQAKYFNVLANDNLSESQDVDPISLTAIGDGRGTVQVINGQIYYDPGSYFDYLAQGESTGGNPVLITYFAQDSFGEITQGTLTITVNGVNDAVQAGAGISDRVDNVGTTTSYVIPANAFYDVDASDVLTYSVFAVTPTNGGPNTLSATITNGNQVTYTPNASHQGYRYQITVRATDPYGSFFDISYFADIKRSNVAPSADADIVSLTIWEDNDVPSGQTSGLPYDMSQHFADADIGRAAPNDTEALTYTITSGETWISVGLQDGILQASPLNQHVGQHTIEVTATDEFGLSVSKEITITVVNVNDAPVQIADVPDVATVATLNQAYSYQFDAVGGAGALFDDIDNPKNSITYSATFADGRALGTAGPGQWLHFDPLTRTFSSANGAGGLVEGDALFTSLLIKLTAMDNGSPAKSTDYIFEINVFPESETATSPGLSGASTELGWDVAVSEDGNWMVAGEPRQGTGENYTGQVRVYNWNGSNWIAHATLNSSNWTSRTAGDRFGYSVDISADGSRIVVGEPGDNNRQGRVFLFQRDGSNVYQPIQTLVGSTRDNGDEFGFDVALNHDGSRVLVGAPGDDDAGYDAGAAYVFNWNNTTALDKLVQTADNGESIFFERFGASVAMDRNVAVIGSPYDTHAGGSFSGSATVVGVGAGGFGDSLKWYGSASQDFFGWSVALDVFQGTSTSSVNSSVVVAVGSPNADTLAVNDGAVYTYRNDSLSTAVTAGELANFQLIATQTAYDAEEADWFGVSVAVDVGAAGDQETNGLRMAVGSRVNGSDAGSVYMHRWWAGAGWIGTRYDAVNVSSNASEDLFGWSVALAGQRFIAGAPDADLNGQPRGAIYSASSAGSQIENNPLSGDVIKTIVREVVPDGDSAITHLQIDEPDEVERLKRWLKGQLDLEALTSSSELTPAPDERRTQDLGGYVDEMLFLRRVEGDPIDATLDESGESEKSGQEVESGPASTAPVSADENVMAFHEKLAFVDSEQDARINRMIASLESLAV